MTANKSSTFTVSKLIPLSILILTYPHIIGFRQSNTQIHDKNHSLPYTCNMKNWSFVLLFIYKSKSISFLFQNSGMKNNMCIHVYYMYLTSFRLSVDFYFKHCFPIAQGNSVCKNMAEYTCTVNGHKYSPPSILRYMFHIKPHFSKKLL